MKRRTVHAVLHSAMLGSGASQRPARSLRGAVHAWLRQPSAIQAANGANLVEGGGAARIHRRLLRRSDARSRV